MMRKALVVGVNDYPRSPLTGCINDATAVASVLGRHGDGSPNFSVRPILSNSEAITRAGLKKAIQDLFSGSPEASLLYFSGHGYMGPYGGYLVTPDHTLYDEGVSMDEVLSAANHSSAQNRLVILDCCHSGSMGSPTLRDGKFSELADGVTVLVACRSDESALESGGQGMFTALLLDALRGGSADLVGNVSPGGIYAYIDRALGPWEQRPVFKTNVSQFVSLRTVTPPIPNDVLRHITRYFPSPYDEHALTPAHEYTTEAPDPEKVKVFQELQKMERVGLVIPVGEQFMYNAAINSKACKLTAMGVQYWKLVEAGNI